MKTNPKRAEKIEFPIEYCNLKAVLLITLRSPSAIKLRKPFFASEVFSQRPHGKALETFSGNHLIAPGPKKELTEGPLQESNQANNIKDCGLKIFCCIPPYPVIRYGNFFLASILFLINLH